MSKNNPEVVSCPTCKGSGRTYRHEWIGSKAQGTYSKVAIPVPCGPCLGTGLATR